MTKPGIIGASLTTCGGLFVWAAHFAVIYFVNTLACARQFWRADVGEAGVVPLTVSLATIIAVAAAGAIFVSAFRGSDLDDGPVEDQTAHFFRVSTIAISAVSVIAIVWNAVPAFIVPPCG